MPLVAHDPNAIVLTQPDGSRLVIIDTDEVGEDD